MNTKGIKFLAVLAVMVMAFAAIVVLAPADNDIDAVDIGEFKPAQIDPTVIDVTTTSGTSYSEYYVSDDLTIKVKSITQNITIYVQNGKEVELDIKNDLSKTITLISVTGDLQRNVTSFVDYESGDEGVQTAGKIPIDTTVFTFTGVKGQTVTYAAITPFTYTMYNNTTSIVTYVSTEVIDQQYAVISSDMPLGAPTIGKYVTIAEGQYIEVANADKIESDAGGIAIYDADGTDAKYTIYAIGADAGSYTLASGDYIQVMNGSVNAKNGSLATVKASSVKADSVDDVVTITYASTGMTVAGVQKSGTITATGNVEFNTTIKSSATTVINNNSKVTGSIKVDGTLILKTDKAGIAGLKVSGTGVIVAQNAKLWSYNGTDPYLAFAEGSTFYGLYDVSAITETAYVENRFATALIDKNQTFIVISDTTVTTSLKVYGVLIINEGVTLTITKTQDIGASVELFGQYAQIINNGEISIKTTKAAANSVSGLHINGGYFENNGRLSASSDNKVDAATLSVNVTKKESNPGKGFVNNGSVTTSKSDIVAFTKGFSNKGTITINGNFADSATEFSNSGTVTLNGSKVIKSLTITTSKKAVVSLVSVMLGSEASVEIKDTTSFKIAAPALDEDQYLTVRGLTITDNTYTLLGETEYLLDVSGSAGLIRSSGVSDSTKATITMSGDLTVDGTATISDGFKLEFTEVEADIGTRNTTLSVAGTFTLAKGVVYASENATSTAENLTMLVTGTVTTLEGEQLSGCKYVAAKYTLASGTTVYSALDAAIEGATEAGITTIDIGNDAQNTAYTVTLYSDVTIPAGMTVNGEHLFIDGGATLYVEETGRLSVTNVYVTDGMVAAENSNDVNVDDIKADVKKTFADSSAVACMSLEVALELAQPGETIVLAQDFVMMSDELVIPAGVTVDATASEQSTAFVLIDSDLTVNGLLIVNEFFFIATDDDTKEIILNDTIMDEHDEGDALTPWWFTPVGVSYQLTIPDEYGNDDVWFVITNIANIQSAIAAADDSKVSVEGDVVLDELTISGTEDQPGEVTFKGDVDIDNINIDRITLIFSDGTEINTTVKNAVGSITITGAYVDKYLSIYDMAIYSSEDVGVYMEGVVTDGDYGTYGILFEGITGMDGTETKTAISYGHYAEEKPLIIFDGETTVIGKKVAISNIDDEKVSGMATITGAIYVHNAAKFMMNCDAQVVGGLVAAERTEEAVAGSVEVSGNIFVGMLESDIYDYLADVDAAEAAAVLSGKVTLGDGKFIYVHPDATVDPAIVEDLDTMDIYIDEDVWFTLYGYAGVKFNLDYLAVPMSNAAIAGIWDAYLIPLDFEIVDGNVIDQKDGTEKSLANYGGAIHIGLDYYIFEVKIKTDGSVKAVYIDGILMETGESKNIFIMKNVAAGTYKVTVEAATGYDADKCVLYTEMGTILPNMGFTFTELDCTEYDKEADASVVVYNISGTEIQPEPVPPTPEEESQWTVTTILLVILVVLIAIMAVIVALRLNRS